MHPRLYRIANILISLLFNLNAQTENRALFRGGGLVLILPTCGFSSPESQNRIQILLSAQALNFSNAWFTLNTVWSSFLLLHRGTHLMKPSLCARASGSVHWHKLSSPSFLCSHSALSQSYLDHCGTSFILQDSGMQYVNLSSAFLMAPEAMRKE